MPQLHVCLENIRSAYNVGSIFRTCETAGVNQLYLAGYTPTPPHPKVTKTALYSQDSVAWDHQPNISDLITKLKQSNTQIISLEITPNSKSIYNLDFNQDACLIFGNEVTGISKATLSQSDIIAQIPMFGQKQSLNIASAAAIAIYEFRRKSLSL